MRIICKNIKKNKHFSPLQVGSFEVPGVSRDSRILPRLSLEEAVLDSSDEENPDSDELPLHKMTLNQLEEWVTNILRAQVAEKRYQ
jgi:hypothetical protein